MKNIKDPISKTTAESAVMSRNDAATYLGVTSKTLAVWASTGRYSLPMVKVGRLAKYRKADLDSFIESRMI